MKNYTRRRLYSRLHRALSGRMNLIQAVVGPRQVGKTTLALQLFEKYNGPKIYESADRPNIPSAEWIAAQWRKVRQTLQKGKSEALLILDEVQKIPNWSAVVKKFFDEDRRHGYGVRVVLLGSSALLMQKGLSESLAGRFEIQRHNQWSFPECRECFSTSFSEYIYFGGYPAGLAMRKEQDRWARYIRDSLIETVLSKDVLLLSPVSKPVLLRQSFGLAVDSAAQIISYQKMLGSLQDAGNTTTIASYLILLSKAFLLAPLERYSGSRIRQRGSIPKIIVLDNGLVSAMAGLNFEAAMKNKPMFGRLIENAVGAQLYFMAQEKGGEVFYWRERDNEIDYVFKIGNKIKGIEVKSSGMSSNSFLSLEAFKKKYKASELISICGAKLSSGGMVRNISLSDFFKNPAIIL